MEKFRGKFLIIVAFAAALPIWSACVPLEEGKSVTATASSRRPACFLVQVLAGAAAQLTVNQDIDLQVRITDKTSTILIDGFEFGVETVTLQPPGTYSVEVNPVEAVAALLNLSMSRAAFPLQKAKSWREAENWATHSKRTGSVASITDSLHFWQNLGYLPGIARTHLKIGDALLNDGDLSRAHVAYEEALHICREMKDIRCVGEAANNSGHTSGRSGDFFPALERLTEAAAAWRELGNKRAEALTLSNLGLLHRQVSNYQQAIVFYERAGSILAPLDSVAYGRVLNNLGYCYQGMAEFERAEGYFRRAISRYAAGKSPADESLSRLNLGRNYLLAGHPEIALPMLQSLSHKSSRPILANALNNLGQALLAVHRVPEAQSRLEEAVVLHRALGDRRFESSDLHFLGVAAFSLHDNLLARKLLTQAIEVGRGAGLQDQLADSLFAMATVEREDGDLPAARARVEDAIVIAESIRRKVPGAALRASFYTRKRRYFDFLVDLSMLSDSPQPLDGLLAAERGRGRALLDLLAEDAVAGAIPRELLERHERVERQLDFLSAGLSGGPAPAEPALRRKADQLVAENQELEATLRELTVHETFGQAFGSQDELERELQNHLVPYGSALLEYYLGPEQSYLWLVEGTRVQAFRLPARAVIEGRVARVVDSFRQVLDRRRSPEKQRSFERATSALSAALLGPLRGVSLPDRLIIVPDGALHRVPFAALLLPNTGRPLGMEHEFVQAPAATYLRAGRKAKPISEFPKAFLAFADPVFSAADPRVGGITTSKADGNAAISLARLPFTAEIDVVTALVPPSKRLVLRGFDANLDRARMLPLSDYAVLHFSTHAMIDDRSPELSRIALSMVDRAGRPLDGFLRPYRLSQLHLDGSILVLSACETALGKQVLGEGLAGFTSSLFRAGASQLVLTVAEVDAEGSSAFLKEVYGSLFSRPPAPSMERSLMLARRKLARSSRWSDPYYWASYVVYGRPSDAVVP